MLCLTLAVTRVIVHIKFRVGYGQTTGVRGLSSKRSECLPHCAVVSVRDAAGAVASGILSATLDGTDYDMAVYLLWIWFQIKVSDFPMVRSGHKRWRWAYNNASSANRCNSRSLLKSHRGCRYVFEYLSSYLALSPLPYVLIISMILANHRRALINMASSNSSNKMRAFKL